jgi:tetratricopeptide (TPR) repeat protein
MKTSLLLVGLFSLWSPLQANPETLPLAPEPSPVVAHPETTEAGSAVAPESSPAEQSLGALTGDTDLQAVPTAPVEKNHAESADAAPAHDPAATFLRLGASLTARKDFFGAESAYRQILRNSKLPDATHQEALLGLARMFRVQGNNTKAIAILQKFLTEYPDATQAPMVMLESGRVLRAMGAYQLAIAKFYAVINSTLKIDHTGFDDYQLLARTAQFEIAETFFVSGDFAEAGKYFKRVGALDLAPVDRARAQFKAAYAQQLGGDLEGAVTSLKQFIEQWPLDETAGEARFLLATTLRKLNRHPEALAVTLELLRTEQTMHGENSKRWVYWQRRTGNQLANEFFQNGDVLSALALYRALVDLSREPSWQLPVIYQIALCEDRLGQREQARADYEKIIAFAAGKNGETVTPEMTELARMATWRIGQMEWRAKANERLVDVSTVKTVSSAPWTPSSNSNSSPANSTNSPSPRTDSSNKTDAPPTTP